jgi:hypothetical protein
MSFLCEACENLWCWPTIEWWRLMPRIFWRWCGRSWDLLTVLVRGHGYESDGAVRRATVQIADWVRSITLDDGARPHGIVYRSDTSVVLCTRARSAPAIKDHRRYRNWLPPIPARVIGAADPELVARATRYRLTIG